MLVLILGLTQSAQATGGSGDPIVYLPVVTQLTPAGRAWPNTSNGIYLFDDQINPGSLTSAQLQFEATHYAGSLKLTQDGARLMRQYNAGFLVLHYRLGQALGHSVPSNCNPTTNYLQIIDINWVQEWPGDAVVQDAWYYHYNGQRVFQCQWGHYLMDLDNAGWRAWWSAQVIQQLQDNEDDGVFADSYSVPNYLGGYQPQLPPVDAAFESLWAAKEHNFSDYIRAQFDGRWKWIPNIGAYITTRDPSDYSNLDGAMIEGFAEWGNSGWFDPADWSLQLNRELKLVTADKILIGQTYPQESDVSERTFILGTYLLVKGSHTYLNLETSGQPEWFPEYGIDLGKATDALPQDISALWNAAWGVYVRHFEKGMVLVNPGSGTHTFNLSGTFYRVNPSGGGVVPSNGALPGNLSYTAVTSLTLNAHQAAILLDQNP
jgi:hypothetical protein